MFLLLMFLLIALLFGVTAAIKGLFILFIFAGIFALMGCWSGYYWYRDRYYR